MAIRRQARFAETMEGTLRLHSSPGESRPVALDLRVGAPGPLRPFASTAATITGRVRISGWADDPHATGSMVIAPLSRGRIDYRVRFTAMDGHEYVVRGHKSPTWRSPLRSMTVLPVSLRPAGGNDSRQDDGADGGAVGEGLLRFPLRTFPSFAASWRFPAPAEDVEALTAPRGGGTRDRLNVWYSTFTDPETGTGFWFHHELVRPVHGAVHTHGWAAVYPPDAPPVLERFGPHPYPSAGGTLPEDASPGAVPPEHSSPQEPPPGFHSASAVATAHGLRGAAGQLVWDVTVTADSRPLRTFPRSAWKRRVLPAVHVVPQPQARYDGFVRVGGREFRPAGAPGASARIAGRGNAHRWAWLHADLDDDTVLEVVTAVSGLPLLRRLPPLVFLRLRRAGRDWPRGDWRSALGVVGVGRFRAEPRLPTWTVDGRAGRRRITVRVHLPGGVRAAVDYTDPDGSRATCHNTERADVRVELEQWRGRWRREALWDVRGTAHAEVGLR
ncbi:hypothetical protein ABZ354_23870 [Streptomyces sp. NPDC005925]|uniref:hypothetical protein n=1 Tax=Streptomyces sp. NPDC005925 TaxID=3157172 RepID=UPI0033FC4569